MKATGMEIRRILRIREGAPSRTTLISFDLFLYGIITLIQRITGE